LTERGEETTGKRNVKSSVEAQKRTTDNPQGWTGRGAGGDLSRGLLSKKKKSDEKADCARAKCLKKPREKNALSGSRDRSSRSNTKGRETARANSQRCAA